MIEAAEVLTDAIGAERAEYEATVAVVWRGLAQEEKDLLARTLDDEIGPWRLLTATDAVAKVEAEVGDQGGCIPGYLAPNSQHEKGLRYEVERLRLRKFLRTVVNGDVLACSLRQVYKK